MDRSIGDVNTTGKKVNFIAMLRALHWATNTYDRPQSNIWMKRVPFEICHLRKKKNKQWNLSKMLKMKFLEQASLLNTSTKKSLCRFVRSTVQKATEANEQFNFVQFAIACPQFDNIRRGLGKIRRKDTPVLPKTLVEIDLDGQYLTFK